MSARIVYSSGRIVFIQLLLLIGFCALLGRLVYLQIYQDIFLDDQVFTRLDTQYSLLASRGKILDRNDNILALDVKGIPPHSQPYPLSCLFVFHIALVIQHHPISCLHHFVCAQQCLPPSPGPHPKSCPAPSPPRRALPEPGDPRRCPAPRPHRGAGEYPPDP